MKKAVFVINGAGGVGKDTLCDLAAKHFKVYNKSTIMPIKDIAAMCGWDGSKDARSRKFLADLKQLTVAYNDYPTNWIFERYREFLSGEEQLMFVHIREGAEIAKFVEATEGAAKTLLIRGGSRMTKSSYGNRSDDDVENYAYDYYFVNDKSKEESERGMVALIREMLV
jgi:hypothetical protein